MKITLIQNDEYTRKAEDLYSKLDINPNFKSISQLNSEYQEQIDFLRKIRG